MRGADRYGGDTAPAFPVRLVPGVGVASLPRVEPCRGYPSRGPDVAVYLHVGAFHDDDWFAREVSAYVEYWKAARPARPGGEVLVPGEKERRTMAERRESGLPLSEGAWADILAAAGKVGMSGGAVEAALG